MKQNVNNDVSKDPPIPCLFFGHEHKRPKSNHEMLFQISPPETIYDEVDGVCHILPFHVCVTFTLRERD